MKKSAILGDTHFGARSDSLIFHSHFEEFYENIFFPELKKRDIKRVFQLGDLFDRRKYINFNSLSLCRKYFFDKLKENDIELITLLGNHDIFYRDTLSVNSTSMLLEHYDNITLVDKPMEIDEFCIIPWICEENQKSVMEFMNNTSKKICLGHFEISGFSMYKGQPNEEGLDRKVFDRFDLVFSGHFHHRSKQKNIIYTGTPYEMTWMDFDDNKGFYIIEDDNAEFIENNRPIFVKHFYDDKDVDLTKIINENLERYKNRYVKVVIVNKTNPYIFDKFMNNLYNINPADISIVEEQIDIDETEDIIDEVDDTVTLLGKYIDKNNLKNIDQDRLKKMMRSLYSEALIRENQ